MSEPVSALQGAAMEGAVLVEEAGLRGMITLRGDHASLALRDAAIATGRVGFPDRRQILRDGAHGLAWMSPDELLILLPHAEAEAACRDIAGRLAGEHHLVANVSDARAVFRISGPGAREVLAKGAPVDLAPGSFEPAEIRRTRLGQVAAAFWMTGPDAFELICFRSVAGHVFDWLALAAEDGSLPNHFRVVAPRP